MFTTPLGQLIDYKRISLLIDIFVSVGFLLFGVMGLLITAVTPTFLGLIFPFILWVTLSNNAFLAALLSISKNSLPKVSTMFLIGACIFILSALLLFGINGIITTAITCFIMIGLT